MSAPDLTLQLDQALNRLSAGSSLETVSNLVDESLAPYLAAFHTLQKAVAAEARREFRFELRARLTQRAAAPEPARFSWGLRRAAGFAAATLLLGSAVSPALASELLNHLGETFGAPVAELFEAALDHANPLGDESGADTRSHPSAADNADAPASLSHPPGETAPEQAAPSASDDGAIDPPKAPAYTIISAPGADASAEAPAGAAGGKPAGNPSETAPGLAGGSSSSHASPNTAPQVAPAAPAASASPISAGPPDAVGEPPAVANAPASNPSATTAVDAHAATPATPAVPTVTPAVPATPTAEPHGVAAETPAATGVHPTAGEPPAVGAKDDPPPKSQASHADEGRAEAASHGPKDPDA